MDKAFEIEPGVVASVPMSLIERDEDQPRIDFDEAGLKDLADDIKANGVQQPITVRRHHEQPGRFIIVYGERRYRASKLAKKKNIPALLYGGKVTDDLGRLLNQVKENHLRADLNPIEWASLFHKMSKTHGLKQAEIEAELKKHKVGKFSRAYISNIMRLLDLPEWARELIRQGTLTAAHGKYLLPAMASDDVIGNLEEDFKGDPDYMPTVREMQNDVYQAFHRHHPDLTDWKTEFDFKEKCVGTGCQKMRKVSHSDGYREGTFCLDRGCYAKFNAAAKATAAKQQPAAQQHASEDAAPRIIGLDIKVDEHNQVDVEAQELYEGDQYTLLQYARFPLTDCENCPHRHIAVGTDDHEEYREDACFNTACYEKKANQYGTARTLVIGYITSIVGTRISIRPDLCHNLLLWFAANGPECKKPSQNEDESEFVVYESPWLEEDEALDAILIKHKLYSLDQFLAGDTTDNLDGIAAIAEYAINTLPRAALLQLADRLDVNIDAYRVDENWLAMHEPEEIKEMLDGLALPAGVFAELETAQGEDFNKIILAHKDTIGVPLTIRGAYEGLIANVRENN